MPFASGREFVRFAAVCVQLALALLVVHQFQLESRTFFNVLALASGGFLVHALLPVQHRLTFFSALSLAAIPLVFGLRDGLSLILLGLLLIGICHLPLRLGLRMALLLASGAAFALWRMELLPGPWSVAIWPILGSMFMFRLALYLYALKHEEKRPSVAATLSYFFMLPNVCFPLFPVVDYLTFRRTHYDRDALEIYETGINWIVRGLVHLLLYRFVYFYLVGDPLDVDSLGDLVQFLLATFLLYLRISGQFHLIAGILHLFGFRLPETHHLYFLASSFTDFWRRINIYWKDFMVKLVYYPSFFALRRYGSTVALVAATLIVFAGTWLLHSYQWFWLRGGFPLQAQDGLFWGTLGALVVMGTLREMGRSRRRRLATPVAWSLALALRTAGTFTAICVLWSLWSAESLPGWVLMWTAAGNTSIREILALAALLAAGLAIAGKDWASVPRKATGSSLRQVVAAPATATLIAMLVIGQQDRYETAAPRLASIVASLQHSTLNARDAALQHKGYYENLDNDSRMSAQLWQVTAQEPADWVIISETSVFRPRSDFIVADMHPNGSSVFKGALLTTNSWGMRDRERSLPKPPGTYRIAMVGPSLVLGSGVGDDETFTLFLEQKLNRSANGVRYEVLNFGLSGLALTEQLALLNERVWGFEPDAVFFVESPRVVESMVGHLLQVASERRPIPSPRLQALLDETDVLKLGDAGLPVLLPTGRAAFERFGVSTRMPWVEAEQRLRRSGSRLARVVLEEISDTARRHGAVPAFVALDTVADPPAAPLPALRDAAAADMLVFDLLELWQGRDAGALRIAPWDNHPNADGNRLIADRLFGLMHQHSAELGLPVASGGVAPDDSAKPSAARAGSG